MARLWIGAALLGLAGTAQAQQNGEAVDPLQTEELEAYAVLIGRWHPDPDSLSDGVRQWREENGISDNWIEFGWGSERQWMRFGDWQRRNGEDRHAGAGLVAYDPARLTVMFTEHSIRGASVVGTLERVSPTEIVRDIVVTRTDTRWRQIDRWVWTAEEDEACFEWTATYINAQGRNEGPANRWCRMAAD
jgi:hypothetical protein